MKIFHSFYLVLLVGLWDNRKYSITDVVLDKLLKPNLKLNFIFI